MTSKTIGSLVLLVAACAAVLLFEWRFNDPNGGLDSAREWAKDSFIIISGIALFFMTADRLDHAKRTDRIGFLERAWLHTDNAYLEFRKYYTKYVDMGFQLAKHATEEMNMLDDAAMRKIVVSESRMSVTIKYIRKLPTAIDAHGNTVKQSEDLLFRLRTRSDHLTSHLVSLPDTVATYVDDLRQLDSKNTPSLDSEDFARYLDQVIAISTSMACNLQNTLADFEDSYTTERDSQLS